VSKLQPTGFPCTLQSNKEFYRPELEPDPCPKRGRFRATLARKNLFAKKAPHSMWPMLVSSFLESSKRCKLKRLNLWSITRESGKKQLQQLEHHCSVCALVIFLPKSLICLFIVTMSKREPPLTRLYKWQGHAWTCPLFALKVESKRRNVQWAAITISKKWMNLSTRRRTCLEYNWHTIP